MIDIGINLTSSQFASDADAVLARAFAAGVTGIILTGTTCEGSVQSGLAARKQPKRLWFTAGVHPHYANRWTSKDLSVFKGLWADQQCVAVGECGLDYFRDLSPRKVQRAVFQAHLDAALESGLPVFLHCREAHDDFIAMLTPFVAQGGRGLVHCFTGTAREAEAYQALGLHIGVTGWVTELQRGTSLREAVRIIDASKLHIETDAPYLVPRNRPESSKGRHRNEPAFLPWVAQEVAALRGVELSALQRQCEANSRSFFGLAEPS
jgi:TatD DNase family protein